MTAIVRYTQHCLRTKYHGKIAASTPCFCHIAIDIFGLENTSKPPMRLQTVIGKGARSMVFSKDRDIQHEQKIASAIRESLLQDPRIAGEYPREDSTLDRRNQIDCKQPSDATNVVPPIKPTEWPKAVQGEVITDGRPSTPKALLDDQDPLERPAVVQDELITSDSPSTAPGSPIEHQNPPERPAVVQGEPIKSDSPSTAPNALEKWSRFPEQNGGLAKVDSGLDYAANFPSFACVA